MNKNNCLFPFSDKNNEPVVIYRSAEGVIVNCCLLKFVVAHCYCCCCCYARLGNSNNQAHLRVECFEEMEQNRVERRTQIGGGRAK